MQRRAAVGVAEIGVGAAVEELADPLRVALVRQVHELEAHDAVRLGRRTLRRARITALAAAALGRQRRLLPQPEPRRRRPRRRRVGLRLHGGGRTAALGFCGSEIGSAEAFGRRIQEKRRRGDREGAASACEGWTNRGGVWEWNLE